MATRPWRRRSTRALRRRAGRRRPGRRLRRGRRHARRRLPDHRRPARPASARTAASTPRSPRPASSASPSAWPCTACGRSSRCSSTRSPTRRSSRSPRTWRSCATAPGARCSCRSSSGCRTRGGIGGVEHHCDSSEAYYAHTPGLKVVTPATVEDAYSLLREAIADPDPVVFLEPKRLYWSPAPRRLCRPATEPFGRAVVRRPGTRRHAGRVRAGGAGRAGGRRGRPGGGLGPGGRRPAHHRAVRRRDRRRLGPADRPVRGRSRRRTASAGVGAEIAARVQERCFHALHAPVLRVAGLDIPYPRADAGAHHLPGVDRVLDAVARLQWDDQPDRAGAGRRHDHRRAHAGLPPARPGRGADRGRDRRVAGRRRRRRRRRPERGRGGDGQGGRRRALPVRRAGGHPARRGRARYARSASR